MNEVPKDWRGNELGVFTKVIYKGNERHSAFRIGTVTGFTPGGMLRVIWEETSWPRELGHISNVWPSNVTAFREGPN